MKKNLDDSTFSFEIVEENSKDVVIEISEDEYRRQLAAGIAEDEIMKPGRHIFRRGGFRERHPNFSLENVEIVITNDEQENRFAKNDKDKKVA